MRAILGPLHFTGAFWYRLHLLGVRIVPEALKRPLLMLFATAFFFALANVRRAVTSNLSAVLGPCAWWRRQARAYRTILEFSWCLTERYELLGTDRRMEHEVEGREFWDRLVGADEGFVLVTAHVGNWEVGSALPATRLQRKVHLVREMEADPRSQEFFDGLIRARTGAKFEVHFAGAHDPSLGLELLGAIRGGEIVALQGDRPRSSERPVQANLFGRPTAFPSGPATLARVSGAPILPLFVFREGRSRSRLVFREPIPVAATADRRRDVEEAVARFAEHLAWAIRRYPHQWFCFRELWPD